MATNKVPGGNPLAFLNPMRMIGDALRWWWLFGLFGTVGLAYGWFKNRYTPPMFTVKSVMHVKEKAMPSAADFLYDAAEVKALKSMSHEIAIMKSSGFLKQVIEKTPYHVSFFNQGNILTTEIYRYDVLRIQDCSDTTATEHYGKQFLLKAKDKTAFELKYRKNEDDEGSAWKTYRFGDTVRFDQAKFIVHADSLHQLDYKRTIIFRFNRLADMIGYYRDALNIQKISRDVSILAISINTTIPEKGMDILNLMMDTYITRGVAEKNTQSSKTLEFIDSQLKGIGDTLKDVESRKQSFKGQNRFTAKGEPAENYFAVAQQLRQEQQVLENEINYYQYLEKYLADGQDLSKMMIPATVGLSQGPLQSLITRLVDLQIQKNSYLASGSYKNPNLPAIGAELEELKKSLKENVATLKNSARLAADLLTPKIAEAERQIALLPAKEREYVNVERLYTLNEKTYLLLLEKRLEAEIAKAATNPDAEVLEKATTTGQIAPTRTKNYLFGLIFGIVPPLLLVIARELLNGKVRERSEVAKLTPLPIIGEICDWGKNGKVTDVWEKPMSELSENFRALRTAIGCPDGQIGLNHTILVSAVGRSEGKSFCAAGLALSLAAAQRTTLLICADLREPHLDLPLAENLTDIKGLADYLHHDQIPMEDIVLPTAVPFLDMTVSGRVAANPADLLLRKKLGDFIQEMKHAYEYMIIDAAPLGLVSDTYALLPHADRLLTVVRNHITPRTSINEIDTLLSLEQQQRTAVVFNDAPHNKRFLKAYFIGHRLGLFQQIPQFFKKRKAEETAKI
jgi:capsular exopolysaccharide synthesis family protein